MKILDELLSGCYLIDPGPIKDRRGYFVKTFDQEKLKACGIEFEVKDAYYSVSRRNVIRGMHFQTRPYAHGKLVQCAKGEVLDVLLDVRPGPDFGRSASVVLDSQNRYMVFAPIGLAHGFLSKKNDSLMVYSTSSIHKPDNDSGIRWDSFKFNWGKGPFIISDRDLKLPELANTENSF